jgi:hypothetical protein
MQTQCGNSEDLRNQNKNSRYKEKTIQTEDLFDKSGIKNEAFALLAI